MEMEPSFQRMNLGYNSNSIITIASKAALSIAGVVPHQHGCPHLSFHKMSVGE
jgi:hypothetical protein